MKFSIRDVLWLTVVVAMGVCWWLDHKALRQAELTAQLNAAIAQLATDVARAQADVARATAERATESTANLH